MRVGLVACVKSKLSTAAPAAELYTSALFRGGRVAVEEACDRWFVLSAKHGLLPPDTVIEPYEETLKGATRRRKRAWSDLVLGELREELGDLGRHVFEVHAGQDYHAWGLVDGLRADGATVVLPTEGMPLGVKLAHYAGDGDEDARRPATDSSGPGPRTVSVPAPGKRSSYSGLHDHLSAMTADRWTASFVEVEEILGRRLPASARRHSAWWSNHVGSHSHARAWVGAGYRTEDVRLDGEQVTFVRDPHG